MEDKKPKIDLKSRLGKKTLSSPAAGSIPPPAGIPKPSTPAAAPPVANPSRVPAPPFAAPQAAALPRVDTSNPYGSMAPQAAPVRMQPQTITLEMSDEFVQAQKSGRKKVLIACLFTAGLGAALGFAGGGISERNKGADAAIAGAAELTTKVEQSTKKANELADVLKSAKEKLSKNTFPDEEVSKLGGINLPFTPADLSGKGIGRFNPAVVSALIDFSTLVDKVNDQKEKLQNVMSGNKKAVMDFLDPKQQVRWSVVLGSTPAGPWATMQPVPTPFLAKPEGDKAKWPDDIHIPVGDKQAVLKRYTTGNPVSEDGLFVPVDPASQASVCPNSVVVTLRRSLGDLEEVLRGDPTPGAEKTGLLEAGQKLVKSLKQIGAATP